MKKFTIEEVQVAQSVDWFGKFSNGKSIKMRVFAHILLEKSCAQFSSNLFSSNFFRPIDFAILYKIAGERFSLRENQRLP